MVERFFSAATYIEQDLLLPPDGTPAIQWESSLPQQRGSEEELLCFVREWGKFEKLHLARPTGVPPFERRQLLPVPKGESIDRIVHDRRPRNAKEVPLVGRSKVLCSGHSFVDFHLGPPGPGADQLRVTSDDLEDYCLFFDATPASARTHALAREFGQFGADCFASSRRSCSQKAPGVEGADVCALHAGLGSGGFECC